LTAALLDEGTARRSAIEIAATAERLGGYFTTGADWDVGYFATGLLSSHRSAGLELLAEVATSPTFPEAEIERLRQQRLAEIVRRAQDPSLLADDRFHREVYRGTVYAHPLLGERESVSRLDREAITAFYRRHYGFAGSARRGSLSQELKISARLPRSRRSGPRRCPGSRFTSSIGPEPPRPSCGWGTRASPASTRTTSPWWC
jgi:hypothetical protein